MMKMIVGDDGDDVTDDGDGDDLTDDGDANDIGDNNHHGRW